MSDTEPTPTPAKTPLQPFEVILSAALAGAATYWPTPGWRAVLALFAPPAAHVLAKLGRWTVNYLVPKLFAAPTPEKAARQAAKTLEKQLRNSKLSRPQRQQLEAQLREIRDAMHQHTLKMLEVVSTSNNEGQPPSSQ